MTAVITSRLEFIFISKDFSRIINAFVIREIPKVGTFMRIFKWISKRMWVGQISHPFPFFIYINRTIVIYKQTMSQECKLNGNKT